MTPTQLSPLQNPHNRQSPGGQLTWRA
jgi:hypothetical protein